MDIILHRLELYKCLAHPHPWHLEKQSHLTGFLTVAQVGRLPNMSEPTYLPPWCNKPPYLPPWCMHLLRGVLGQLHVP